MKKVTGWISARPLGCYDFEFFIEDDATKEEIEQKIEEMAELSIHFDVEEGYEAVQETVYRKRG